MTKRVAIFTPYIEYSFGLLEALSDHQLVLVHPDFPEMEPKLWAEILDKDDWIISFGHRKLFKPELLQIVGYNAINIHISLLPWNRGANPNFWSWFDNTPKGISIHRIDDGIDTGQVYVQSEAYFRPEGNTLRTTWEALMDLAGHTAADAVPKIIKGEAYPKEQPKDGSYHRKADIAPYQEFLAEKDMDTPVEAIIELGRQHRAVPGREI